jgi:hypothetical protein
MCLQYKHQPVNAHEGNQFIFENHTEHTNIHCVSKIHNIRMLKEMAYILTPMFKRVMLISIMLNTLSFVNSYNLSALPAGWSGRMPR